MRPTDDLVASINNEVLADTRRFEYRREINEHDTMARSAYELGVHIWPQYPPELGPITVRALLGWINYIRTKRIRSIMKDNGLTTDTRLEELTDDQRMRLSASLTTISSKR